MQQQRRDTHSALSVLAAANTGPRTDDSGWDFTVKTRSSAASFNPPNGGEHVDTNGTTGEMSSLNSKSVQELATVSPLFETVLEPALRQLQTSLEATGTREPALERAISNLKTVSAVAFSSELCIIMMRDMCDVQGFLALDAFDDGGLVQDFLTTLTSLMMSELEGCPDL